MLLIPEGVRHGPVDRVTAGLSPLSHYIHAAVPAAGCAWAPGGLCVCVSVCVCPQHVPSRRRSPSRPSPGCLTEWDGVSCWSAVPVGQSRAVACPDILHVFKKSKGAVL